MIDNPVWEICERVAEVQALLHDHAECGNHTAADVVAKAQAVLSEPELPADNTFGDIAIALRKPRMRHRIKGSAMRTTERVAFRDGPCKRHFGCLHI